MKSARGGAHRYDPSCVKKDNCAVLHRDHVIEKRSAFGCNIGFSEHFTDSDSVDDRAVAPIIIALNMKLAVSQLSQRPVQIKLVPVNAPCFDGADLLVAADCTAYAYANFHNEFIRNRITLIGCLKLDGVDYADKLTAIIANNDVKSVTVVRMEVPCCGGIENAVKRALMASGKFIPWRVVTISTDGRILD